MSSDFYFKKWKDTLTRLEKIIYTDLDLQETKAHDKKRCDAAHRLSGVLGQYISIYNDVMECLHQNIQVQKTSYMVNVVKALVSRILELKHELRRLEVSECHFFGQGLIQNRLTSFDAEIKEIPAKVERPEHLQAMINEIVTKVREERQKKMQIEEPEEIIVEVTENWWDTDAKECHSEIVSNTEIEEKVSEETLKRHQMISLIQGKERSRQVIRQLTKKNARREMWTKALNGTLQPQAPYEMRERSARLIQKVCRAYMELKRKKIQECKLDEILGIKSCGKPNLQAQKKAEELKVFRATFTKKYECDWKSQCEDLKQQYLKRNADNIKGEYRDFIRNWFQIWFDEIKFFHDIPNLNEGGLFLIIKDEIPSPNKWLEEYEAYLEEKKSNKNKSAEQLKWEKQEEKREEMLLKKEELLKKKLEAELLKKMMKNPNLHPGYNYPRSKKTEHILQMIESYRKDWDDLDFMDTLDVKEKSVRQIDFSNVCKEVKLEILTSVDEDMRIELNMLKKALKNDYARNGEKMLEPMKKPTDPSKREKKKRKVKTTMSQHIASQMEYLAVQGFLKDYPPTKLSDFLGDHNFAGDNLRCLYVSAVPLNGETRNSWWARCRDVIHGFHKILLVGPKNSGKTKLVHALASVNGALLFELDPGTIPSVLQTAVFLQELVRSVASCAKAAQPAVIHIKHVQRLFYSKVPSKEADTNFNLLKRYFIQKLFKSIHGSDKITIIGTCIEPWLAKSSPMLKKFPAVLLLPDTSYSTVIQILKDWVLSNHMIPSDLDVNSLAYVLQGYSYGYLTKSLQEFLTPERIIRIAAHGLSPAEVYNYFIDDEKETKTDYAKYMKWYAEKTEWGQKESLHIEQQREFKLLTEMLAEKAKKKKPGLPMIDSATSVTTE